MSTTWDAADYAVHAAHHRRHDAAFLDGIALPAGARVLDVGCGVGDLTARIAALGEDLDVLGVDADAGMVAAASASAAPGLRFAVCRAQELDRLVAAESMDAVFSNAALHWIPRAEHPAMLAQLRRVLRTGGMFRAQLGGRGQVAAVRAVLDEVSAELGGGTAPWFFPSPEEYVPLLTAAGFAVPDGSVRLLRQVRPFADRAALQGFLRSQTFPAYEPTLPDGAAEEFRRRVSERAMTRLRRADGTYDLDFVRLDLLVSAA
jgi:trans-aconitate 2-methyltransferase